MRPSKRQLALLHVAKQKLGLTNDDWRALLLRLGGTASARELDAKGYETVLASLERLGFTPSGAVGPFFGDRPGMATPQQVQYMRDLWRRYPRGPYDERELDAWLSRKFGVDSLRFVDVDTASRALCALRQMAYRPRAA
jgi:hypothetical protein